MNRRRILVLLALAYGPLLAANSVTLYSRKPGQSGVAIALGAALAVGQLTASVVFVWAIGWVVARARWSESDRARRNQDAKIG